MNNKKPKIALFKKISQARRFIHRFSIGTIFIGCNGVVEPK